MKTFLASLVLALGIFEPSIANGTESRSIVATMNLDGTAAVNAEPASDASFVELEQAAGYSTTIQIYDSLGANHPLVLYFFHTIPPGSLYSEWIVRVVVDGGELSNGTNGTPFMFARGSLTFDANRKQINSSEFAIYPQWRNGAKNIPIYFRLSDFTTLDSSSAIISMWQNGCKGLCPQVGTLDFDGDAQRDFAIWRPSLGLWAIRKSSDSSVLSIQWGLPGDYPISGDFTGDGLADLVVWRPSNGTWYLCESEFRFRDCPTRGTAQQFGLPGDRPLAGDFDTDGLFDFAVWRPSNGLFIYMSSRTREVVVQQWGLSEDIPLGAAAKQ